MAALSFTQALTLLNESLRSNGTKYLALFINDPGADGTGTEVSGTGYNRMPINFGTPSVVNGKQTTANSSDINFGTAGSAWGTISYWAIYDSASGGEMLWYGAFNRAKTVEINDGVVVSAGQLTASLS